MKSCTSPVPKGVECFAEKPAAAMRCRSGSFQAPRLARHWRATSAIWGASTQPPRSSLPRAAAIASAPITGGVVRTGEQTRTRRRARPIASAIRCERSSPWPGANHARIPSCQAGSTRPLRKAVPPRTSCSKSWRKSAASAAESTTTITFSCRDQESSVQFVDPVQTEAPSRITYFWCIRSGTPAIGRASTGSEAISSSSGEAGGGTGIGRTWSTL